MTNILRAFRPYDRETATVSVTTTTGRTALGTNFTENRSRHSMLSNDGSETVFVRFGDSTVEATTADVPLLAGTVQVFSPPADATHIAAITASGTSTLYVTAGEGI